MKRKLIPLFILFTIGLYFRIAQVAAGNWYVISDKGRDVLVASHLSHDRSTWREDIVPYSVGGGKILSNSPLYYSTLTLLYRIFPNPIAISVIIAIASSMLVIAAYGIGMRFGGVYVAVVTGLVVAVSFPLVDYGSHISQPTFAPLFVGLALWMLFEAWCRKEDFYKSAYCLLSILFIWIGLLYSYHILGIVPVCILCWLYVVRTVHGALYKTFIIGVLFWCLISFGILSAFDINQVITIIGALQTHTSLGSINFFNYQRIAELLPLMQTSWIMFLSIPIAFLFWVFHKRGKTERSNILFLGILLACILSQCIVIASPLLPEFYAHYFSPIIVIVLFFIVLPMSLNRSIFGKTVVCVLIGIFMIHSVQQLYFHGKNHYSLQDAHRIADVILQKSSFIQNAQRFSIMLPSSDSDFIDLTDWNSGGIWYAIEQKTGIRYTEIVPTSQKGNNIFIANSEPNYLVICFDDPQSRYFHLDKCLSDWKNKALGNLRFLSIIPAETMSYYIFETHSL